MTRKILPWEDWKFGPESRPSTLCPFLGTNYCRDICPDWQEVRWDCSLKRCKLCDIKPTCHCTVGHLPRPISLPFRFILPTPNGTTHYLTRAEAIKAPPSCWLLCDPRQGAKNSVATFEQLYGTYPHYFLFVPVLGIILAGPICDVDIALQTTLQLAAG